MRNNLMLAIDPHHRDAVFADPDTFRQWDGAPLSGAIPADLTVGPPLSAGIPTIVDGPRCFAQTPVFLDGQAHRRFRSQLDTVWRNVDYRAIEHRLTRFTRILLTDLAGTAIDLVTQVAAPVATAALTDFLGLDPEPWTTLTLDHPALWGPPQDPIQAVDLLLPLQTDIWNQIETCAETTPGVVAAMTHTTDLSPPEIATLTLQLAFAANGSAISLLSTIGYAVATSRILPNRIRNDPRLARALVTHLLDFNPPLIGVFRRAATPARIGGHTLPPDTGIYTALAPAPHTHTRCPFVAHRPARSTNKPFGAGVHRCPGIALTHVQARVLVHALTNFSTIGVDPGDTTAALHGLQLGPRRIGASIGPPSAAPYG